MSRLARLAAGPLVWLAAGSAGAQDAPVQSPPESPPIQGQGAIEPGEYRDRSSFEMFHGLRLNPDGTFQWALSVGALDRRSAGTWAQHDGIATLTTAPTPIAPQFRRDPDSPSSQAPFLIVRWPTGAGIAGVDVILTCADGAHISDYTQEDGWQPDAGACRSPETLELVEPIHGIGPARFDISGSTGGLQFTLVPNDFGVADLTGTQIAADAAGIVFRIMDTTVRMDRILAD